jgi:hypothetical protein
MTTRNTTSGTPPLDLDAYRTRVEEHLEEFLTAKAHAADARRLPTIAVECLRTFLGAGCKSSARCCALAAGTPLAADLRRNAWSPLVRR